MAKLGLKEVVLGAIGGVGGTVCYLLGGYDVKIKVLIGFMMADVVTGVIDAAVFKASDKTETGALSSKYSAKGFFKKIFEIIAVGVCVGLDNLFNSDSFCRNSAIFYLIGQEVISLTENFALMGFRIPVLADAVDLVLKRSQMYQEKVKKGAEDES